MKYDSIIIGFGKGGKTLAGYLAKQGEKVALVEKSSNMYGGTCINVGCIPSKSLVKNGDLSAALKTSFSEKKEFYRKAIEEKNQLTAMLREKNYRKLADLESLTVIDGKAEFINQNTLKIIGDKEEIIAEGEKIFINTGAYPFLPPIQGIEKNENVFTSETLMDLKELPEKLAIIGGGYIGLEFASIYASMGSKVSVIDGSDEFLSREDEDIAEKIRQILENKGIKILSGARAEKVEEDTLFYKKNEEVFSLEKTKILIATGRRPNTKDLKLDKAGVNVDDKGLIEVDENNKTTAENIWALGDVAGPQQFTYISLDDFRIVKSSLRDEGKYNKDKRKNVPYSVFISPSFSRVGLNEKEAKKQGLNYKIFKMETSAIPKAQVLQSPEGMLKALVEEKTGKILGAMLICEESHEMINLVKLAMDLGADYTVLRDNIYTHPTMMEAFNDLFQG
ncbi:MAG: FAD-dependent oxidoreductase [Gallicola sp.]|nr:FAD-dependent oxidoreductase [Gallicola sp.]